MKGDSMRRFLIAFVLVSLISTLPALGDERAPNVPSLRDRAAKVVRIIKRILLPVTQGDEISVPHP
jgi:hypothetical protein